MGFRDLPKWLDVPQLAPWSGRKVFSAELELYQDNRKADGEREGKLNQCLAGGQLIWQGELKAAETPPCVLSRLRHSMFMFLWVCSLTQEKRLAIVRSVPYVVAYG